MTLQEILDAVMERYPHSYTDDNIIKKLNIIQRELFRTLYKPETSTTYDIIADNPFYPIDYSPQTIIDVVVNGAEYPRANIRYDDCGSYYYITDDNCIGLYPTPTEDAASGLTVFRYEEPAALTTADTGVEPAFDKAWHMLLVYRICKDLAEIALDANMVNVFVSQINGVESEYKRTKVEQPYRIVNAFGGMCW